MTSIKDLAEMTGYSVATISRVINNSPKVSEEARRKVEEAIQRTGYYPNFIGRNLRSATSAKIMILLPTLDNTFYSEILLGAEKTAQQAGYQIIVGVTQNTMALEADYISMLRSRQVDGMILANTMLDKFDLNRLAESFPVALVAHKVDGADISSVCINNVAAAREATEYLISIGHRKIALLSGQYYQNPSTERELGYRQALEAAGIPFRKELVLRTGFHFSGGYKAAKNLLEGLEPNAQPSAFFCVADSMAIGVMRYLMDTGLNEKISVLGFDNVLESEYFFDGISTVNQPKYDLGQRSIELILNQIKDPAAEPQSVVLPHQLIIRGSTRPFENN